MATYPGSSQCSQKKQNAQSITMVNVRVHFPRPPYDQQIQVAKQIMLGVTRLQNVALELPTGCGKTMSMLCSLGAFQVEERHKLKDIVEEMKALHLSGQSPDLHPLIKTEDGNIVNVREKNTTRNKKPEQSSDPVKTEKDPVSSKTDANPLPINSQVQNDSIIIPESDDDEDGQIRNGIVGEPDLKNGE
ncbi:Fanconi anemia group J protein homolog [Anabrus simplex]|uniref:Fanconi anemia group J protein homolog n=1 Tax=Anabrus simplex TaxID=316456 RepID=UPI0035A28C9B